MLEVVPRTHTIICDLGAQWNGWYGRLTVEEILSRSQEDDFEFDSGELYILNCDVLEMTNCHDLYNEKFDEFWQGTFKVGTDEAHGIARYSNSNKDTIIEGFYING